MRTADHVLHKPSGETWVVAYVEGDDLVACGWPLTMVPVSDCELVKAATDEDNEKLLKKMSVMLRSDPRCYYAKAELLRRAT